jgi:hypothetical protein
MVGDVVLLEPAIAMGFEIFQDRRPNPAVGF